MGTLEVKSYFGTFIICIATVSVIRSIGLLPYIVSKLKGKILCRSVGLTEADLKNADSEKFSEVEKKNDPFQTQPSGKIHEEVQQRVQKDYVYGGLCKAGWTSGSN